MLYIYPLANVLLFVIYLGLNRSEVDHEVKLLVLLIAAEVLLLAVDLFKDAMTLKYL